MITDKDIEKITKANLKFGKEVFTTKEDLGGLKNEMNQKFNKLQTSVDGLAKNIGDYHQEMKMLGNKVDRNEGRIERLELKTELKSS